MSIYRHVHINYWQDAFILDLTPEEKYFYVYLLTNSKTKQCGIYELPIRIIETETGYNRETVDKLLNRFEEYDKIVYDKSTKEIYLKNWTKHNKISSFKVKKCVEKELSKVKSKNLIKLFLDEISKLGYEIDYNLETKENRGENNFKDESIYSKPTDEQLEEARRLLDKI